MPGHPLNYRKLYIRMTMTKAFKQLICRVMIAVMLLAQLSIAAYACPANSMPDDMVDCDQMAGPMDKSFPNLCAEQCHQGHQSDQTQVSVLPVVALISLYTVDRVVNTGELDGPMLAGYVPLAAPPPPLSILHCCFRT